MHLPHFYRDLENLKNQCSSHFSDFESTNNKHSPHLDLNGEDFLYTTSPEFESLPPFPFQDLTDTEFCTLPVSTESFSLLRLRVHGELRKGKRLGKPHSNSVPLPEGRLDSPIRIRKTKPLVPARREPSLPSEG